MQPPAGAQPVALVSVDDYVAATRVYADRVNDLVRRLGCTPGAAAEVVQTSALALLDALMDSPDEVGDLAGWWFAHAYDLGRRVAADSATAAEPASASLLAGTEAESRVRAALAELPERERLAVLLRDVYDLPMSATAVALHRPEDVAAALVGVARLHLVSAYDGTRTPTLEGHTGRPAVDVGTIARFMDGSMPPVEATPLRRHVHACTACDEVSEAQARGRRLARGLPVAALGDEDRAAILAHLHDRARTMLPSLEEVLLSAGDQIDPPPLISPGVVIVALIIAVALGVAIGAASVGSGRPNGSNALPLLTTSPSASVSPSVTPSATAGSGTPSTSPSATVPAPVVSSTAPSSPPPTSQPPSPGPVTLTIAPPSGPNGTVLTVSGTGWTPNHVVNISYRDTLNQTVDTATATADSAGRFSTTLRAYDPAALPGAHAVVAGDGTHTLRSTFTATN